MGLCPFASHNQTTPTRQKKLKYTVLEEKVKTRVRMGLGPAGKDGAAPLMGRMASKAQYEENERVEANVDWRKVGASFHSLMLDPAFRGPCMCVGVFL